MWSVTPVTIKETYTFTIEATFVTQVPMPVIIIDPIIVNIDKLEREVQVFGSTSYSYTVTNYGLIDADVMTIYLPSSVDGQLLNCFEL